jgi:hypothetical protein
MTRFQITFLALVGCQAGHAVEEYVGQVYVRPSELAAIQADLGQDPP